MNCITVNRLKLVLAITFVVIFRNTVIAVDFPDPSSLPSQPGLPDPLVMRNGMKVTTAEAWNTARKPELKDLFQHYMYGYLPPKPQRWTVEEVTFTDPSFLDGKATLSESRLAFFGPDLKHRLHVLLVVPNSRKSVVPVFVGMNFCGNHTLAKHSKIHIPESWVYKSCVGSVDERATEAGRGGQAETWNLDLIIDRGYALASLYSGDIDPDTPDFNDGIQPSFHPEGQTSPKPDGPGTIAAWAWGFHRVVDFLIEKHSDSIDSDRIIALGHSRLGKTALLAAAMDDRIALAIPHQAGCGGTAPSRVAPDRKDVETIRRINTSFPHWFCDNFPLFNETPEKLPFDQNCLVALCAPRPVLYSNAIDDQWANPDGQFEVLKGASDVYRLFGLEGIEATTRPELGHLVNSRLGYFIRAGKHSMSREDWMVFLDFADRHLKR